MKFKKTRGDSEVAIAIIGGSIVLLIIVFVAVSVGKHTVDIIAEEENPTCARKELVSLSVGRKTEGNISGGFFLIFGGLSGKTEEKLGYTFYLKNDDGSYVLGERPMTALIYEDEEEEPYLVDCGKYETKTEFHIPEGSIISDYKLNAK